MHRAVASVIVLWAVAGTVAAQLPWKLPPPVLTRIDPPSAAPGATIDVYGKNLNPQAFVGPRVVFETRPTFSSQSARAISNTQLRVVVPLGSGTIQVHVETAGGNSNTMTFMYKTPTIASLSPASGGRDQVVTIIGQDFGVKQALDSSSFIKFGDSLSEPVQWDDQRIVVKAPMDFGTGTNTNILLGLLGCAEGYGTTTEAANLILDLSLPGCNDLFISLVKIYQLVKRPGFLERQVQVVVRTAAGTSNQRTFTYRVQAEISGTVHALVGGWKGGMGGRPAYLSIRQTEHGLSGTMVSPWNRYVVEEDLDVETRSGGEVLMRGSTYRVLTGSILGGFGTVYPLDIFKGQVTGDVVSGSFQDTEGKMGNWSVTRTDVSRQADTWHAAGDCYSGVWWETPTNNYSWLFRLQGNSLQINRTDGYVSGSFGRTTEGWRGTLYWDLGVQWNDVVLYVADPGCRRIETNQRWTYVRSLAPPSSSPGGQQSAPLDCPPISTNPVVPNAHVGEFCHGTLVIELPDKKLIHAVPPKQPTHTHAGVDLAAPCGSPVYPLTDGLVVDVVDSKEDRQWGYLGYMVRLKHGTVSGVERKETFTIYLHLKSPPTVKRGELVLAGQMLGRVGDTGHAQGCHTHFEIRHFRGQLFDDANWNNIYGKGNQTSSPLFQKNWEDPQKFLNDPAFLSSHSQPVTVTFGRMVDMPSLPVPFYDRGACPFEGCTYRQWKATADILVHQDHSGGSPVTFTVGKGEWVTGLTGVVVITNPGKIRILRHIRFGTTAVYGQTGEILSALTNEGEGFYKGWFKGKLISGLGSEWASTGRNACAGAKPAGCTIGLELKSVDQLAGEFLERAKSTWWVQIRNSRGQTGWTDQSDKFDNMDSLAQSSSQMPDAIKAILDRSYRGWTPPQSSNYDIATCKQPNPGFKYWFVWGDFNGDGKLDYAAEIANGTATYVIVFMASGYSFQPAVVERFANSTRGWAVLGVAPKGAKLPDLQPTADGGFVARERMIQADALLGIGCETSAVAYIYSNSGFKRMFIKD